MMPENQGKYDKLIKTPLNRERTKSFCLFMGKEKYGLNYDFYRCH